MALFAIRPGTYEFKSIIIFRAFPAERQRWRQPASCGGDTRTRARWPEDRIREQEPEQRY